jgi:hypothetical protein
VQAEPGMIAFTIARARRILLISFALPVTREKLQRLDAERSAVIRGEGAMDMIVDFSAPPAVAIPTRLTHERVSVPSPVPGFRRIYVAALDETVRLAAHVGHPARRSARPDRPQRSSVAGPFAGTGQPGHQRLDAGQVVSSFECLALPVGDAEGDGTLRRQRLQESGDIAFQGDAAAR